ncbi:MAG: ABC transporter permease subunit [Myxococcota bacterium]
MTEPRAPSRLAQWLRSAAVHLAQFVATLLGAVLFVQCLLAFTPGDAIDLMPNADVVRPQLEREWGLDRPLPERLVATTTRLARGDLGTSLTYRPGMPVAELVWRGGTQSLALLLPAVALGLVTALALGAWTAGRRSRLHRVVQAITVVPAFLAAYVTVTALNAGTWWLMEAGHVERPDWFALPVTPSPLRTAIAITVLAWASGGLSDLHAACDAELRRLRTAPFVEAARARGAAIAPHVLHNLVPPLASLAAARVATVLGTLVIVEKVMSLNGAGATLWQACLKRDYPLAIGITLVAAAVVCGARLVSDLVRITVDPRLRGGPT